MSQFLNYITKKQAGGDISSLPGVLSLSKIQRDIQVQKEKRANKKGPTLSQYTPKLGDAERMQANREAYLAEQNKPLNRLAASQFAANLMDNILEPMFALEAGYGAGQLLKAGVKKALTKAPTHSEELVRGPINWWDEPGFKARNPNITAEQYVNNVGKFGRHTVEEVDESLMPFDMTTLSKDQYKKFMSDERLKRRKYIDPFTNKKKGGAIVDPRGQWAHPGKDTIIPTKDGRITMKGVPYPVYGQDETGYGQLMMPGGEYSFPGKTIYEKPLDMFNYEMAYGGQMIRRADGSYSKRGLWDNIRANRGSGKKPTKEMLEQERKIRAAEKARYGMEVYQQGGEPDGEMALGQINAAIDKLMKLREFIQPSTDLEPWVSSKLTMMDHYSDAVSDYMMYNPEATEEGFEGDNLDEMAQGGGIPERYKNMGFNKVGVKKKSNRPGKKWMVLAKKGDQYKVVHGGYKGMQDYTQHGSEQRRKNFWNRMGGKNSSKATDPFSPLYWHKRFGTWEDGGEIEMMKGGGTFSGNMYYQDGGEPKMEDYPDFGSYRAAYEQWLSSGGANPAQSAPAEQPVLNPDDYKVFFNLTPTTGKTKSTASYSGPSIVDMLNSMGKASDYQSRKKMAQELGITNYRGTAAQNTQMMRMLMEGVAQNPTPAPKKAAAKPKAAATQTAAKEQTAAAGDNFFEMAKRAYLAAHPGMTSEQYDRQVAFTGNPNTISQAKTPLKGTPRQGEYSDAFILSQIDRDPRSQKNINKRKRQEFAEDLAMGTLAPWLAEGALMALTTRYLPHGLKALPQVVEKARDASRALPAPMKRLPGPSPRGFVTSQGVRSPGYPMYMNGGAYPWKKQFGGPMEGEELEVTPEELEMLRAQGYEFEMI